MVSHSGAPLRPDQLRPLNQPQPIDVTCDRRGHPISLYFRRRRRRVIQIIDCWRIDDEWWRKPLRRIYYLVETDEGGIELIYHDLEEDRWYRQRDVR